MEMATRLEAEVRSRVESRSGKVQLLETQTDEEQEAQNDMLTRSDSIHKERAEELEEFCNACREFFLNLKFAILDDQIDKSFQFLKHARIIAKDFLIR